MFARVLVLAPDQYHSSHHFSLMGLLRKRLAMHRSRAALSMLDEHLLKDIGLSKAEAMQEAQRPVWR